jgi:hypothetical protein
MSKGNDDARALPFSPDALCFRDACELLAHIDEVMPLLRALTSFEPFDA